MFFSYVSVGYDIEIFINVDCCSGPGINCESMRKFLGY